ncbi:hypothetical protein [Rhodopseudomonas telluris]|uniref:C-type lysozyme inhibitor domain-containing protein n=1 Tax=Rhodopseudomonas telluris TaxID=644215 RepID=A0ABV6F052_9BRAD
MTITRLIMSAALALPLATAAAAPASAHFLLPGASFSISCADGASYVLRTPAVGMPGEIVTAHLHLAPHRAVPVRLIPMGDGYRYAGRGIWLDGIGSQALLYRTKYQPTACVIGRT